MNSFRKYNDTVSSNDGFSFGDSKFQDQLSINPATIGKNVETSLIGLVFQTVIM